MGEEKSAEETSKAKINMVGVVCHFIIIIFFIHTLFAYLACKPASAWGCTLGLLLLPGINLFIVCSGMSAYFGLSWILMLPLTLASICLLNKKSNRYNFSIAIAFLMLLLVLSFATSKKYTPEQLEERSSEKFAQFLQERYGDGADTAGILKYLESDELTKRRKFGFKLLRQTRMIAKRNNFEKTYNELGAILKIYQGRESKITKKEAESLGDSKLKWRFIQHLDSGAL
jgi:hypothetical protein